MAAVCELAEIGDLHVAEGGFDKLRFDLDGHGLESRRMKDQERRTREQRRIIELPERRAAQLAEFGRDGEILSANSGVGTREDDPRGEEGVCGEEAVPSRG